MKEAYFNTNEEFGTHSINTLRILEAQDLFYIMKGGIKYEKEKLKQAETITHCKTEEEAKRVIEILCSIEKQ